MGLVGGIVAAARPAQAGLFGGISEDVYVSDTVRFFLSSFFLLLTFVDDAHQALTRTQTHSLSFSLSLFLCVFGRQTEVLGVLKQTLALTNESTDADVVVESVRNESNKWVAKYRRQSNFNGRPSYGNTYSAINAVLGHYNNFGSGTLFPKRRLERVVKEVDDAGRALSRGR